MTKSRPRIRSDFNLGVGQAENDPLLDAAFHETGHYASVISRDDRRCFLLGRTGSGKSAMLQRLETIRAGHVVRISPEDLALPYVTDLGVFRVLQSLDVHLDPLFIALWKHVLVVELIRHRYQLNSPEAKETFLQSLREKIKRDPAKEKALEYLEEFEGRFWCEAHERVRHITEKFEERITNSVRGQLKLPGVGEGLGTRGSETVRTVEDRIEERDRFQRIVNDAQLPRLSKMLTVLNDDILDSEQHFTYVVIDDLDRDWVDERVANDLIWCLFRAVADLQKVRNVKVLVALRTNIFEELRFSERARGQEEKFRALILAMKWTKQGLTPLLDERVRVAASNSALPDINGIRDLLPSANKARGNPLDFVLEHTLMRPRDAIAFLNEALLMAVGSPAISWAHLHAAVAGYSRGRLLALRDEWKTTFPGLDAVLECFRGCPATMDRAELAAILDEVALLPADPAFAGVSWVTEMTTGLWTTADEDDWTSQYAMLARLMYNLGVLGCSSAADTRTPVYSYADETLLDTTTGVERVTRYHVHPAFRAALDVLP